MTQQNEEERVDASAETERKKLRPQTTAEVLGIEKELFNVEKQIMSIFYDAFSPDYMSLSNFHKKYVTDNKHSIYVYTLDDDKVHTLSDSSNLPWNSDIGGVAVGGIYTKEEWIKSLEKFDLSVDKMIEETPLEDQHFPISVGKMVMVHPNHQGKGIGFRLLSELWSLFRMNPPGVGTIWGKDKGKKHRELENLLEKFGSERLATYENIFPEGWRCVKCGFENECDCGAILYSWGL